MQKPDREGGSCAVAGEYFREIEKRRLERGVRQPLALLMEWSDIVVTPPEALRFVRIHGGGCCPSRASGSGRSWTG